MDTKQTLIDDVKAAQAALTKAQAALANFDALAENNVFASLDEAIGVIEDKLLSQASNDCEGSYNCGDETYSQEFIVDGQHYVGTLHCEYNRHDKTYYYVDSHEFTYSPKDL